MPWKEEFKVGDRATGHCLLFLKHLVHVLNTPQRLVLMFPDSKMLISPMFVL